MTYLTGPTQLFKRTKDQVHEMEQWKDRINKF